MMHSVMACLPCLKVILDMRNEGIDLPELQAIRLGGDAFSFYWNRYSELIMKSASNSAV